MACSELIVYIYIYFRSKQNITRGNYAWILIEYIDRTSIKSMVKAPNIAHLSLLTSVAYNKKETKLKKCTQPNKVNIIQLLTNEALDMM